MMKLGGIQSVSGAVNILLDKVGEPYITSYIKHVSNRLTARKAPYAIVPDIHSFNLPIGRQRVNDSQNTSAAEAFFEIKTYTACSSRYNQTLILPRCRIDVLPKSWANTVENERTWIPNLPVT